MPLRDNRENVGVPGGMWWERAAGAGSPKPPARALVQGEALGAAAAACSYFRLLEDRLGQSSLVVNASRTAPTGGPASSHGPSSRPTDPHLVLLAMCSGPKDEG